MPSVYRNNAGVLEKVRDLLQPDNVSDDAGNTLQRVDFWAGTQEDYDAIPTKDPDTLYFVLAAAT